MTESERGGPQGGGQVPVASANPLSAFATRSASRRRAARGTAAADTVASKVKAWAWRFSAAYVWISFLANLLGQHDVIERFSTTAVQLLTEAVARIGFLPTDPSYLAYVLKASWLLAITEFSLIEVAGFFFYVIGFPVGVATAIIVRVTGISSAVRDEPKATPASSASRRRRIPLLAIAVVGLLSWFVLYADAVAVRLVLPGLLFAGLLFGVLFYRFFRRVKPIGEEEAALLGRLEILGFYMLEMAGKFTPSSKADVALYRWLFKWTRRVYRRLAIAVRGRRGRDRVSIFVLLEYALSAIMLAVAAVIFWGLAIKCAVSPAVLVVEDAIQVAASHFIPGLTISTNVRPPFWASVAAGATAWLLFVVVLAPAGSVLPSRQEAHAARLARTYRVFRVVSRQSRRFLLWLDSAEAELAPA